MLKLSHIGWGILRCIVNFLSPQNCERMIIVSTISCLKVVSQARGVHCNRRYSSAPKLAKRRHAAAIAAVLASTVFIQRKFSADFNKQARNDSILIGQEWLDELLIGHPK